MDKSITHFMNRKIVALHEEDKVVDAALIMFQQKIGCVMVVNNNEMIIGILTDRDIVRQLITPQWNANLKLSQIMEKQIICLTINNTLTDALDLMKAYGVRRLPIVEQMHEGQKKCLGLVTLDDLIAGQFVSGKDLSDIIKSQIKRKTQTIYNRNRSESRTDQTYHKFLSHISTQLSLSEEVTKKVFYFIIESLLKRITYTGAAHFLSQLPKKIQYDMYDIPVGPDRNIEVNYLLAGVANCIDKNESEAKKTIFQFWKALCELIGYGETDQVIRQLPDSMKIVFMEDTVKDAKPEYFFDVLGNEIINYSSAKNLF